LQVIILIDHGTVDNLTMSCISIVWLYSRPKCSAQSCGWKTRFIFTLKEHFIISSIIIMQLFIIFHMPNSEISLKPHPSLVQA